MGAKLTDFYVLKMNKETKEMYAVKTHGAEFIHKGSLVRVYVDKRHTLHYVDPESGVAFDGYALPFRSGYNEADEKLFLRTAPRFTQWKRFKRYQETIKGNPEEHAVWIRRFEAAPRYETEQEAINDISAGM